MPNDGVANKYSFTVDLSLPIPNENAFMEGLATYLPSFNQTFSSLDAYTGLLSFIAQGSGASIVVEVKIIHSCISLTVVADILWCLLKSVHASAILVKTSAAEISGVFNASDSCFLETVLA